MSERFKNCYYKKTLVAAYLKRIFQSLFKIELPAASVVEAALVMPIFIFASIAIMSVFFIVECRLKVCHSMYESIREITALPAAMEESPFKGERTYLSTLFLLRDNLNKNLSNYSDIEERITGGKAAISIDVDQSLLNKGKIKFSTDYYVKVPVAVFAPTYIKVHQEMESYAWLGDKYIKNNRGEDLVYVTAHGTCYHKDKNCTYLAPKVTASTLVHIETERNNNGEKYRECEICSDNMHNTFSTIYITDYGNRYHYDRSCSAISHEVLSIPISEAGDRPLCSKEK